LLEALQNGKPPSEELSWEKQYDFAEEACLALMSQHFTPQQMKRFEELACQLAGPMALRLDHYAARFKLSDDQRAQIERQVNSYEQKVRPLTKAYFESLDHQANARAKSLALELDRRILNVLSANQRRRWKEQLGEAFDWGVISPPVWQGH
jgi:hypothetical protein